MPFWPSVASIFILVLHLVLKIKNPLKIVLRGFLVVIVESEGFDLYIFMHLYLGLNRLFAIFKAHFKIHAVIYIVKTLTKPFPKPFPKNEDQNLYR